jgi:hypothetical protein
MVMNSPLETERSSDLITSVEPNDLEILLSSISAMIYIIKITYLDNNLF